MFSHWLLRSVFTARSVSANRFTIASVGDAAGLFDTVVPPNNGSTFEVGSAPLPSVGPFCCKGISLLC